MTRWIFLIVPWGLIRGKKVNIRAFQTSGLDGHQLYLRRGNVSTHWIWGSVGEPHNGSGHSGEGKPLNNSVGIQSAANQSAGSNFISWATSTFLDGKERGIVVGWGTMLHAGRSRVRVPMRWIFLNWPNLSSRTTALRSTQPLREMSTRNLPGGKGRPARKADNLTAICELDCLEKTWEPRRLNPMGLHGLLQG
jgi:hypothetical protein